MVAAGAAVRVEVAGPGRAAAVGVGVEVAGAVPHRPVVVAAGGDDGRHRRAPGRQRRGPLRFDCCAARGPGRTLASTVEAPHDRFTPPRTGASPGSVWIDSRGPFERRVPPDRIHGGVSGHLQVGLGGVPWPRQAGPRGGFRGHDTRGDPAPPVAAVGG